MRTSSARDQRSGGRGTVETRQRRRQRQHWRLRPSLMVLEERTLLSIAPQTYTVTNTNDSGAGSLRAAVLAVDADTYSGKAVDTIVFNTTAISGETNFSTRQSIFLSSGKLELSTANEVGDDHGPGRRRDDLRQQREPGIPGRPECRGVDLKDWTITGGSALSNGGGLYNLGMATLTNCIVSYNSARNNGGGVDSTGGGTATLTDCIVRGNTAGNNGGGVFSDGAATTLTNCPFNFNSAGNNGGGVDSTGGGTATLTDCVVTANTAGNNGGGVFSDGATPTLTNCVVTANTASFGNGGGVFSDGAMTTLAGCDVVSNTARFGNGGGLFNQGTATLTNNCIVFGNTAGYGNGVAACTTTARPR